ncbi:MAG: NAD(P)-dependent oxidoreductase, partial [Verrucomicrobiae bacterium]|nr:NAD(P)-dependent oxidoreductase [Verrucomicrobiae bacterium]
MLPFSPATPEALDDFMTRPCDGVLEALRRTEGDLAVFGAGGKMGFHLALMLQKAVEALGQSGSRRVTAVSRFGSAEARRRFEQRGIVTLSAD